MKALPLSSSEFRWWPPWGDAAVGQAFSALGHGRRSEAFYYSLLNFSVHISGLLQALAMFTMGILFGYVSGDQPGPQPGSAFRFLISVFPAASALLVWMLARRFIDEIAPKPDKSPLVS